MAREKARVKRKERKNISTGVAHVNASFNNTKILIADAQGNAIAWSSAGTMGFKGSRKSTPYAAQMAAEDAGKKAQEHGVRTLEVEVQGPGSGRESALRALGAVGLPDHRDPRRDADRAQRLPPAQAPPRLIRQGWLRPPVRRRAAAILRYLGRPPANGSGWRTGMEGHDMMIHKNWQELIRPTALEIKPGADPHRQATAVAEPLERGFGLTLGNALRRVLMSSLQGAAITSVQIDGVLHEFSSGAGRPRGRHRHRAEPQGRRR